METIQFKSRNKTYTIDDAHYLQDNGHGVLYISVAHTFAPSVPVPAKEFKRIKPYLSMQYRKGFGGMILKIYTLSNNEIEENNA